MVELTKFPPLSNANQDGLLAMGGELNTDVLVSAYSQGIFPWYNPGQPILWWSPNPRLVMYPNEFTPSRSLRKSLRKQAFELRSNTAFNEVIDLCASRGDPPIGMQREEAGTWITMDMKQAYVDLHTAGYAHSIETWLNDELVGGLYGIALGSVFFGESMFSRVNDASKIAFWALCEWLQQLQYTVIDCQITNQHLLSLGAREIQRNEFVRYLSDIDVNAANAHFHQGFDDHIRNILKA